MLWFFLFTYRFLESFFVPPLTSFSLLSPPLFLELLQHMWAFGRKKCSDSPRELFVCSEEHSEDPLGCTRSLLILAMWFLPDVFPIATFLQCPSSFCIEGRNKYSRITVPALRFPECSVTENWQMTSPLCSPCLQQQWMKVHNEEGRTEFESL